MSQYPPFGNPQQPNPPGGYHPQPGQAYPGQIPQGFPPGANPYATPQAPLGQTPPAGEQQWAPPPGAEVFAPCPRCGCQYADRVKFSWWGGLVGPKLFTHVKCRNCASCYNGKHGTWNTTNIVLYTIAGVVLGAAVVLGLYAMR